VLGFEEFQYGPERQSWQPGFIQKSLPSNVTRYITSGAGVSAPSENLGFYFSGMRAADWGLIQNGDGSPNTTANTLITVDMSVMRSEQWTNDTLPRNIPPRANAELVWVPVSAQGVLIAIGGVINPAEVTATQALTTVQAAASVCFYPVYHDLQTSDYYAEHNKPYLHENRIGLRRHEQNMVSTEHNWRHSTTAHTLLLSDGCRTRQFILQYLYLRRI
jgi:hypothetical protein